ncbi:O-methyltransferase, partial [Nitrospinae bacterium AH-259-F20]|nr:O-methyltransferase [Nitrospinae bacterium AH-259-F20]
MNIIAPAIESYLESLLPERHPIFREMEAEAKRKGFPIVGPLVGSLLALLARAIGARTVLELGSGFGYSALWFAQALPPDGHLLALEGNPDNARDARAYFARAGLEDRATFKTGDALELIEAEPGPFDIIFNDIDKDAYPEVVPKALRRLRTGGLLIADNALWSGRVTEPPGDTWTAGLQAYNRLVASEPTLMTTIVPIR